MSDERWRQVDKIFHDALALETEGRGPLLDRACGGDASLRKEVESLIRAYEEAGSFMDSPARETADGPPGLRGSSSLAGRTFGRYELLSLLGSGGMGDVYRARDSELKRDIAIKVLPDVFSRDAERVARFRREAEVLASLNHPNIATIYDFETLGESRCLVLELVEGETLAQRLARGPIPVDEALRLAKQIADALETAHEKGIIHRDLKPANIKITPDGTVKVLDFGLAKVREGGGASGASGSNSRVTMASTPGMIMGTAAYMAPEQARGKAVDKRADIWAFGCVLYEMLTGRALFGRETATDTLAAILERDPEWSTLPATTPAAVQRLLLRCLDKSLRGRLHDIGDARIEIEDVLDGALPAVEADGADRPHSPTGLRWSIAVPALLVALLAIGALTWRILATPESEPAPPVSRTVIGTPGSAAFRLAGLRSLAILPDGKGVLYISGGNGLWLRRLDQLVPRQLVNGAAPLNFVFPSADGKWAIYVEGTQLKKVALAGGPALSILGTGIPPRGATWAPENTIIFADRDPVTGLKRVSAEGGEVTILTRPDTAKGQRDHLWPEMLPGGRAVLFTITAATGHLEDAQVAVLDLITSEPNVLVRGSNAHYISSGHLLYAEGGKLWGIGFDLPELKTTGDPFLVLERMVTNREGAGDFDVSANGTLVYADAAPGTTVQEINPAAARNLVWVDRMGKEEPLGALPDAYQEPRVSPDGGRRVAVVSTAGVVANIRIWDRSLRLFTSELTPTDGGKVGPIWLDKDNVAYFSPGDSATSSMLPADGTGKGKPLGSGPISGVTPDGKYLLFSRQTKDLTQLPLNNAQQVETLLETPSIERNAVVSPDGQWLAYESDKDGSGPFEIWIAPYSNARMGQGRVLSVGGGRIPLWNPRFGPGNQELFYVVPDDGAIKAMRVSPLGMRLGDAITVVEPGPYVTLAIGSPRTYDVSPDGQQFLLVKKAPAEKNAPPPQIILVQNWLEELKRLVPAKR